jgi:hypothetical protein
MLYSIDTQPKVHIGSDQGILHSHTTPVPPNAGGTSEWHLCTVYWVVVLLLHVGLISPSILKCTPAAHAPSRKAGARAHAKHIVFFDTQLHPQLLRHEMCMAYLHSFVLLGISCNSQLAQPPEQCCAQWLSWPPQLLKGVTCIHKAQVYRKACDSWCDSHCVGGGVGRFVLVRKGRVGRGERWRCSCTTETAHRTQGGLGGAVQKMIVDLVPLVCRYPQEHSLSRCPAPPAYHTYGNRLPIVLQLLNCCLGDPKRQVHDLSLRKPPFPLDPPWKPPHHTPCDRLLIVLQLLG